ncbi:MAG: hypothetical protein HY978_00110 [Candidatus Liptonbacteria bacterium]|nr:hypothetical protein [Candidatus Liptonbacteria bacterium]
MNSETRTCQNCHQDFTIDPGDFDFYRKIDVPPPTWCPRCRLQRRLIWRNERNFYRDTCGLCGKDVISAIPKTAGYTIYCSICWYSDRWDPLAYGQDYNFSRPFLEQFHNLMLRVPHRSLVNPKSVNSDYTNYSAENKNCYIVVSTVLCEDCAYGYRLREAKNCFDCVDVTKSEFCYECLDCAQCSRCAFCAYCQSLVDCFLCYDCRGLNSCFGCVGLRNKSHHWLNQPLQRSEYEKRLHEILDDRQKWQTEKTKYQELLLGFPRKYAHILRSERCTGDNILTSKNCKNCFFIENIVDSRHVLATANLKDSGDVSFDDDSELDYEIISGWKDYRYMFAYSCWYSQDVQYSASCLDSSFLFGCVGLRNKKFCVLNQQYSKEEYEKLVPQVIEHMNTTPYTATGGRVYKYGEYFPPEFSPFPYNESVAQEHFPLTKEEAITSGYAWKEPETRNYQIDIRPESLPNLKDATDDISNKIIGCAHDGKCHEQCTIAFKIIPPELQFYRRMNIFLPRLCPNCRHHERRARRNPMKLWHRHCGCGGQGRQLNTTPSQDVVTSCEGVVCQNTATHFHGDQPCPNEFETSYAPDRLEIVYCERCYQSEVA